MSFRFSAHEEVSGPDPEWYREKRINDLRPALKIKPKRRGRKRPVPARRLKK